MSTAPPESEPDLRDQQYKLCPVCRYATLAIHNRCRHCLSDISRAGLLHPEAARLRLLRQDEIEAEASARDQRRRRYQRLGARLLLSVMMVSSLWWGYRTFIYEPPPLPLPLSNAVGLASPPDSWPISGGDAAGTRSTTASSGIDRVEAWRVELGAPLATSLIADTDRIYATLTNDHLLALDLRDGTVVWDRLLPVAPIGAPTVARVGGANLFDGSGTSRIYVPLRAGQLLALDAETGDIVFSSVNTKSRFNTSPVIVDGTAYVFGVGALNAIDALSGDLLWTRPIGSAWSTVSPVVIEGSVVLASGTRSLVYNRVTSLETYFYEFARDHPYAIAIDDGIVYTASGRVVVAYDIGSSRPWWEGVRSVWFQFEIWQMAPSVPPPPALWATRGPPKDGFPMAISEEFLHLANSDGDLRAYSRATGELVWAVSTSSIVSPPIVTADGLLIGHRDRLAIYDLGSGQLLGERLLQGELAGSELDDLIVTTSGTYVATTAAELIALR